MPSQKSTLWHKVLMKLQCQAVDKSMTVFSGQLHLSEKPAIMMKNETQWSKGDTAHFGSIFSLTWSTCCRRLYPLKNLYFGQKHSTLHDVSDWFILQNDAREPLLSVCLSVWYPLLLFPSFLTLLCSLKWPKLFGSIASSDTQSLYPMQNNGPIHLPWLVCSQY